MARQAIKFTTYETTVENAVSDAISILTSLGEEMRDWASNLEEKFSATEKYSRIDEAASALEGLTDEPTIEDAHAALKTTVMQSNKRRPSRSDRRDDAVNLLDAAASGLRERAEAEGVEQNEIDALESLIDDIERIKDEAEAVEFVGMYG